MELDINIYAILETNYKKYYRLPDAWDTITDIKTKNELLSKALNSYKKIEDLEEYKNIIEGLKNEY